MTFCQSRTMLFGSTAMITLIAASASAQDAEGLHLGTIVVTESKREVQTDTAVPITEIDQDEMDDRQAGTVAELIDSVPGVNLVNGSTPQGSGINIRGFGANGTYGTDQKVAVQIDGASVGSEEIYRLGTQIFTDPELYREVNVIRGTVGSFEFGSGIVGGVVQLETKDASDFTFGEIGFAGRESLQYSSNGDGFVSSTILAWQPSENLEMLGNFTWRQQNEQTDGDGNTIGASDYELPSRLLKGRYRFGVERDQALTLSITDTNTDEKDVPYDTFQTTGGTFGNVDRTVESRTVALNYDWQPLRNDLINLNVNLSYADQQIDQEYVEGSSICDSPANPCNFPGGFPDGGFGTVNADHQYETTKLTVKNTSFFSSGFAVHDLRTGFEVSRRERKDANSAPGGTDDRVAVFLVDDMRIGTGWTISPALRYEHSHIDGSTAPNDGTWNNSALMGGLSARYEFANGFALFASGAYTENLPIIDDLGDPVLMHQPEKARTWEAGGSFDNLSVLTDGDAFAIKANLYQTKLWDVTSYTTDSQNIDDVETEGLEVEASYSMPSGVYIDMNLNIADGEETLLGNTIDWRSTPADSIQVTVGKTWGDVLDLSWELVADRSIDFNGQETPGFGVHNIRATYVPEYNGILSGTVLRVGVENLFDHDYTPHLSTRPAPGRNIKLQLAKAF
ncbi:TonB-dependent receptor domain-containing protein [Amaricoccus tamworthensis]|uniref:TonB-dependent receptor domain-containing protein n=1 Tax=Amaricoccus tamworthensis TaxID=57002 RepID=UPI003C7D4ECB